MSGSFGSVKNYLDSFVCNGNNVIYFKLIRDVKSIDDDEVDKEFTFQPEFCHQLFGQSENIFGYKNLRINLYYSACKLVRFISITYSDKVDREKSQGVPADDVLQIITEKLGGTVLTSVDQFSQELAHDTDFKPYGTQLDCFKLKKKAFKSSSNSASTSSSLTSSQNAENSESCFEIYRADMDIPGFESYHQNMQTFLTWFIDAASYIDTEDRKWDYYLVYEKCPDIKNGGDSPVFYFAGYATVYRYYAYPDKTRPRISQFLILPPFQRRGIGERLLQNIYHTYAGDSNIIDITVEDPSEEFTRLRDYVDCKNCAHLMSFQTTELKKGWNEDMVKEAQEKFKLAKKQIRRVYEILKFKSINKHDEDQMRNFRLEVKNRLNAPSLKMKRSNLSEDEESSVLGNKETRLQELNLLYCQLEDDYKQVINKLTSVA